MANLYWIDIATSTTAGSTTFPEGFRLVEVVNLDGTNSVVVSVVEAIDTGSAGQATLGTASPANSISYKNVDFEGKLDVLYHDASAGTPSIRCYGYIK